MKFLVTPEPASVRKVLIVQTCNPNLLDHVTRDVVERYPDASVTVLLQRGMRPWIAIRDGVEYRDNPEAGRKELIASLKDEGYDVMVTVLSGESGYWKLKLLPFLTSPATVRVYDRIARTFVLNAFSFGQYLAEVAGGIAGAANPGGLTLRLVARRLAAPALIAYLLFFHARRRAAHADLSNEPPDNR